MPPKSKPDVATPRDFSISRDLFVRIAQRLRLVRDGCRLRAVSQLLIIPMVALVMAAMPVDELLRSIGDKMVGGLL